MPVTPDPLRQPMLRQSAVRQPSKHLLRPAFRQAWSPAFGLGSLPRFVKPPSPKPKKKSASGATKKLTSKASAAGLSRRQRQSAVYGVSGNPVTGGPGMKIGHVGVMEAARRTFDLKKILFVPAFSPPHKKAADFALYEDRLEMARLATRHNRRIEVSDIERQTLLKQGFEEGDTPPATYTLDTLRALFPRFDTQKFKVPFIIGTDAFRGLASWGGIKILAKQVIFLLYPRDKDPVPDTVTVDGETLPLTYRIINGDAMEGSASEVRAGVRDGKPVGHLICPDVEAYIRYKKLYKNKKQ